MACYLNTSKTKVMLITTRQRRAILADNSLKLAYNDINLEITTGDKILGIKN